MSKLVKSRLVSFVLTALISFSIPLVLELHTQHFANAQTWPVALGLFRDSDWEIELLYAPIGNTRQPPYSYDYIGISRIDGSRLRLNGGVPTQNWTDDRREHVWYNSDYQYIVAWRPSDPDFIRLRVLDPYGVEILNRLLEEERYRTY